MILEHLDAPNRRYVLSPTAAVIWNCLQHGGTVERAADAVAEHYDLRPAAVAADVSDFISFALGQALVTDEDSSATRPTIAPNEGPPSADRPGPLYETLIRDAESRHLLHKASIELTYQCNLRCIQCYVRPVLNSPDSFAAQLDTTRVNEIISELQELGCLQLTLTGGDIFARRDIDAILRHTDDVGCSIRLQTNGSLVTERHVSVLKSLTRLEVIEVSLFGATAATYEVVTTVPGSFARLMRALERLSSARLPVLLKYVLMRQNAHEVRLVPDLAARIGVRHVVPNPIIFPSTLGNLSNLDKQLIPSQQQELYAARLIQPPDTGSTDDHWLCRAGIVRANITPTGEVWPCERLPYSFGNVRAQSVRSVWEGDRAEHYRSLITDAPSECVGCPLRSYCSHCWAMPYLFERLPLKDAITVRRGFSPYNCHLALGRKMGCDIQGFSIEPSIQSQLF